MFKKIHIKIIGISSWIGFMLLILSGCDNHPTAQGQQYLDKDLSEPLNLTKPKLSMPVNINDYLAQVQLIEQISPSLYRKNEHTYQAVNEWLHSSIPITAIDQFSVDTYQLAGQDHYGNVHFTGYYTPVLKARHQPDETFCYPLYRNPLNVIDRLPTRKEIYQGALANKQLEIAYTASLMDNFIMEVQGSGYLDFEDGQPLVFLGYNGKNGYPYQSIGRLLIEQNQIERDKISMQAIKHWAEKQSPETVMELLVQNDSAVFFKQQEHGLVIGSTGVPLIEKAAVASDPRLVPSGSVLLVEVPLLNQQGAFSGQRELRLMVALDVGGAIKGQHLDLYQGIGDEAGEQAGFYNHYGRVWLLKADSTTNPTTNE